MIIPGIFEQDFEEVKSKVKLVEGLTSIVQIDIADGVLVDGKTFPDFHRLNEITTPSSFELHIMTTNPLKVITSTLNNITKVCAQIEAESYVADYIRTASELGYVVGLSISPQTPLDKLDPYISQISYVQFMTVVPGGSGRPFNYGVVENIKRFKSAYPHVSVQVDGGIDLETLPLVVQAGVDNEVVTSHLFDNDNVSEAFINLSKVENDTRAHV